MRLQAFAISDIGLKRRINQDAFLKNEDLKLYVVADGMGGHRGGEVASRLAVEVIERYCKDNRKSSARDVLDRAVNQSCQEIYQHSKQNEELSGMGTTVLALLFQDEAAYIAQVGDSRAYLLNQESIWQITEDHSLLNEEMRAGRIHPSEVANYQFKNVITRSVGYEVRVNVDIYRRKVQVGDTFLLCSDGLSGLVEAREIHHYITKYGNETGIKNLVALANERGGDDNITALVCQVLAG